MDKINNGNPFVYSLKKDTGTKISQEELAKFLLELEIKRIKNKHKNCFCMSAKTKSGQIPNCDCPNPLQTKK